MPDPVKPRDRMVGAIAPKPTKLPPLEYPTVAKVVKIVKKPPKKPVILRAKPPIDDQFSATLEFSPAYGSDAGRTYGPLSLTPGSSSPESSKDFYVRCRLEQHRVDPLLQGFRTYWDPPPGWTRVDGLKPTIYDEAISNPLYINRVYHTPATISLDIGFLVVVKAKYRP